jgi:hypothetical protein
LYIRAFGDHEFEEPESSSSVQQVQVVPSSSSMPEPELSSSSEEESPSSSSSGRGPRSSASKLDPDGYEYEDYPTLEPGAPGVYKGVTTRYWDGCRPGCSYFGEAGIQNPLAEGAFNRACAKDGISEIPLIFLNPRSDQWGTYYTDVPSAWESGDPKAAEWFDSETYQNWMSANPQVPAGSNAYTCFDTAPMIINDTLAYAFVATHYNTLACGECARLQFNTDWTYDTNPRITHRALKGKTLIVIANNTGTVDENQFDIMIPGGGLGANDCFSEQLGLAPKSYDLELGRVSGGLLSECIFGTEAQNGDYRDKLVGLGKNEGTRAPLNEWQECLRQKCHRVFDGKSQNLLDGCLWHAEWFMSADNPEAEWVKMPCPQKLVDKYKSVLTPNLPNCRETDTPRCQIDGLRSN